MNGIRKIINMWNCRFSSSIGCMGYNVSSGGIGDYAILLNRLYMYSPGSNNCRLHCWGIGLCVMINA